ncbi:glycoside hydrolase family 2 protein [Acidaminobacter sp. JC074]|uniref:glycoside hydrolase family 2 protein n=1 Tax=Acidaminobacter sp. JC074 TaxID=2530199 RepID=UPI001F11874E|nr:glycoside hydrolase family 2 TIM barrel-domain containing protein [Acidaminobacter sp. JC074]MCH4885966.1 glycoside hydrolase family 2 protein [Acidaminobacter sp. JC074]
MRRIIPLNRDWGYKESFDENDILGNDKEFSKVQLPHANKTTPYNCFDEKMYQFVSAYRKNFKVDHKAGERVFIDFEGVMTYAKVYINGHYLGDHKGGYTPFSFDMTDYLQEENVLTVMVDSTERNDIPPFGFTIDYLCYGGIYREVNLRVVDENHIDNVFVKPRVGETNGLELEVFIKGQAEMIEVCIFDEAEIARKTFNLGEKISFDDLAVSLWEIDAPKLYEASVNLIKDNQVIDTYSTRFGFRSCEFKTSGFYLNGKKIKIRGLNRHQAFPYVGYAMPKRAQKKDADILKYDLGLNLVRTSHYPQSRHFLDRCDEIGLLVFEEIPGWQHIGDKAWQDVAVENVREMIERDWNHPSIILWGTRINESMDNHDFYKSTHELAKSLDDTRQTGGVRCIENSELIEDVYTMNDFNLNDVNKPLRYQREVTGLDREVPYLVTEYNGHMYPTKRFDSEERMVEHCKRHLLVQNDMMLQDNISGAIGWCAFDYNTHFQFGSGDRICYHGVMDMFRIPKFASYVYKSQADHDYVLEPVTLWARGEKGEFEGKSFLPLTVLSNCEKISVTVKDETKFFYPKSQTYKGLSHAPFEVKDFETIQDWGSGWQDGIFKGYVNDQVVVEKSFSAAPIAHDLEVSLDDVVLESGDYDVTRMLVKVVDQSGNILPYINESVDVHVIGVGQIIGPKRLNLIGGCIGAWIKTNGQAGSIEISVESDRFENKNLSIQVK